ncbi:MAG: cobalamin-binding protein, partial [Chloroflexaceae bacterium]|nr:cobalamin-binding protein [Chloroflexaceae bacterium]
MLVQTPAIVSLLPSATEILAALGFSDHLVGRSHECDYPPSVQALPVCTQARLNAHKPSRDIDADVRSLLQQSLSIYEIDLEQLERLQPTHLVTQDQCEVCAVSVSEVQQALSQLVASQPQIVSLQATTLSDVWSDIERVASALHADAKPLLTQLDARLNTCQQLTQTLSQSSRPTVAALEWTDPPMAAGNWIPELIAIAGG